MDLEKILYAEDEEDIQIIAQMSLEEMGGYRLCVCQNGLEVLEKIDHFQPQMILLDVMMPKMDGLEAFEKLQQEERYRKIPMIFMTAKVQSHEVDEYLQKGAAGVIIKPFDPMELPGQIATLWEGWQKRQSQGS